ncbi:MAG TPA: GMC family oxidoreductase [Polyangia bacterium]|nr:GMC family oxidoreductase [Polyangia bacterium]
MSAAPPAPVQSGRILPAQAGLRADVVVVGTGAGGAMAARELARRGLDVIALEEGGYRTPRDFNQREDEMLALLFAERGARATADLAIHVLQGRGVGGSTVHNTNLCKRMPDAILEQWALEGGSPRELAPLYQATERDLDVAPMDWQALNPNNDRFRVGVSKLGYRGGFLAHNRRNCVGSGFCELGCSFNAKQNALKLLVPQAAAAGARIFSDVRAERITTAAGRASGVEATVLSPDGRPAGRLQVTARAVVLGASATGSAALVLRSGLPDPHQRAGRNLHLHPGVALAGVFDDEITGWKGIPQSYECTEFLDFSPGSGRRVWILPAFAHPIGLASALPGFGADHMRSMRLYRRIAVVAAMVHDETAGRVSLDDAGRMRLEYRLGEPDAAQLAVGLREGARILLAAGARRVLVPYLRPLEITSEAKLDQIDERGAHPHDIPMTAVHPMSTLPMGHDPAASVVDARGQHHQVRGLWVCDGSLFPTSIGVPPQISIYTFARRSAGFVADSLGTG